ncbi:hypothetical protein EW146_g5285 [Bondarzewia mesenterica]|uniref:Uracil permease n=1 Tax=Bondarzewia mesenterica TaxID=1095465 RepID=A0A4S4LT18_9AGAM|nr:hypothetical protein EW146_g5285 [Bondarzewia mesenterica]
MASQFLHRVNSLVKLEGNEEEHEKVDAWSNRDLIPLPPSRRTWGFFEFFGYWTLSSLNISTWQTPNTYLTAGLSVGQSMAVIVIGRSILAIFSTLVAWCGLRWHIGFTIQNRYTWGMRGSYVPLIQRVLLNFIWNAVQTWNGGRLVAVLLTAIFPSFAKIKNSLPDSMPATTSEMIGFFVFWFCSIPFLWLPPEKFRRPFQVTSIYCGTAMLCMLIWSLSQSKGVGPVFYSGSKPSAKWSTSWIMLNCLNSAVGSNTAGVTNGSDFSRYGKSARGYIMGTFTCLFCTGTMVSFIGLVVTAAAQKIYGEIYWNPPDLLMRMMDSGEGSSKARAGVFFLALGFTLTSGFENICGNAVAGGVDLAGMFPRYINIRRGAIITFFAAWIVQPWQLINRATTFLAVLSSFSVFLAPIMGLMCADFFILRRRRIKHTDLYDLHGSYFFWHGFNLRAIPAWLAGWAPTVGGLAATAQPIPNAPRALFELYYISFFLGFSISFIIFIALNFLFPVAGLGEIDDVDYFGAFTDKECKRLGIAPLSPSAASDSTSEEKVQVVNVETPKPDLEYQ